MLREGGTGAGQAAEMAWGVNNRVGTGGVRRRGLCEETGGWQEGELQKRVGQACGPVRPKDWYLVWKILYDILNVS